MQCTHIVLKMQKNNTKSLSYGQVHFQDNWLTKIDYNGTLIGTWARPAHNKPFKTYCICCDCEFVSDEGFEKLIQHAGTKKHKKNLTKLKSDQLKLSSQGSGDRATGSGLVNNKKASLDTKNADQIQRTTLIGVYNPQEASTRIELLTCLDMVNCNIPARACEGKRELYEAMFPGCVPASFSLSPSKAAYLINYALGPHFKNMLLIELQAPDVYFTIQYDETTNVKDKKGASS